MCLFIGKGPVITLYKRKIKGKKKKDTKKACVYTSFQ